MECFQNEADKTSFSDFPTDSAHMILRFVDAYPK